MASWAAPPAPCASASSAAALPASIALTAYKKPPTTAPSTCSRPPVPYGLVRAGVAPDHQQIKVVTKLFERVASAETFRFFGNVTVGRDIDVDTLHKHYDILLFCYGAASDRHLNIDGEDFPAPTPPQFRRLVQRSPHLHQRNLRSLRQDRHRHRPRQRRRRRSRILARSIEELEKTDIADYALEALKSSNIKDIYMIGRRGPAQGAFNDKELHELLELKECDVLVDKKDLELADACQQELEDSSRQKRVVQATRYRQHSSHRQTKTPTH